MKLCEIIKARRDGKGSRDRLPPRGAMLKVAVVGTQRGLEMTRSGGRAARRQSLDLQLAQRVVHQRRLGWGSSRPGVGDLGICSLKQTSLCMRAAVGAVPQVSPCQRGIQNFFQRSTPRGAVGSLPRGRRWCIMSAIRPFLILSRNLRRVLPPWLHVRRFGECSKL